MCWLFSSSDVSEPDQTGAGVGRELLAHHQFAPLLVWPSNNATSRARASASASSSGRRHGTTSAFASPRDKLAAVPDHLRKRYEEVVAGRQQPDAICCHRWQRPARATLVYCRRPPYVCLDVAGRLLLETPRGISRRRRRRRRSGHMEADARIKTCNCLCQRPPRLWWTSRTQTRTQAHTGVQAA